MVQSKRSKWNRKRSLLVVSCVVQKFPVGKQVRFSKILCEYVINIVVIVEKPFAHYSSNNIYTQAHNSFS